MLSSGSCIHEQTLISSVERRDFINVGPVNFCDSAASFRCVELQLSCLESDECNLSSGPDQMDSFLHSYGEGSLLAVMYHVLSTSKNEARTVPVSVKSKWKYWSPPPRNPSRRLIEIGQVSYVSTLVIKKLRTILQTGEAVYLASGAILPSWTSCGGENFYLTSYCRPSFRQNFHSYTVLWCRSSENSEVLWHAVHP